MVKNPSQIVPVVLGKKKATERPTLIPSGSIMLNLACSNKKDAAFIAGTMVNLIGDSNSGKTYLAMEMLAQCANNPNFDNYTLIYDDAEHALAMDIEALFGSKLSERIKAPRYVDEYPEFSKTIEDFHCNICDALDNGSFIYVLDSFDALSTVQDDDKVDEMRKARENGREISGSYRLAKPKKASELLQNIVSNLAKTKSFLMIISQTRDNISPMAFEPKVRSGGRALKFYASHEIWLAVSKKIKSKERVVGTELKCKVTKNKLTGTFREVSTIFRHSYGTDDITTCINFLISEGVIEKVSSSLKWHDKTQTIGKWIKEIEDNNMEQQLFEEVEKTWLDIEKSLKPDRKSKY